MKLIKQVVGAVLCLAAFATSAQSAWPDKPIKFVVPYGAGAMGDVVSRLLAEELRSKLGEQVLVENKAGAGGNIGTGAVAHAAPDGYTFLVAATNNLVVNQFLFKNLGFDPLKAFDPVTMLVEVPSVIFMSADVPVKTFAEFVAHAKSNKGKLNYGSPGIGTTPHLSMFKIDKKLGLDMAHVPYQGSAPGFQALLANQVQVFMGGAGLGLSHVRAGKLRAIAVSAKDRLGVLPDTPTFQDVGLGDIKASNWWALAAPHGTPDAVVERLSKAIQEVMQQPKLRERFAQLGVMPIAEGPKVMGEQLAEEIKDWERSVAESGAKVN